MENSVEKPDSSEICKKSRSSIYSKHSNGTDKVLNSEDRSEFENRGPIKGKRTRKEVSLTPFGFGIKRRRNGSNALRVKPNFPLSDIEKEENSSSPSDSTCSLGLFTDSLSTSRNGVRFSQKIPENARKFHGKIINKGNERQDSGSISQFSPTPTHKRRKSKEFKENKILNINKKISSKKNNEEVENLEENAARMLCSLFDQSSNTNSELLLNRSDGSRVLRPKRNDGKGFARKRRHFYEVCPKDLNPFCVVKQRIKVYWPLDRSWYFGLVKEYDPVTRLHHVRYDDRDEEWINLKNERFKLLLFPSEIDTKFKWNDSDFGMKRDSNSNFEDEIDSTGSSVESEPIISWLARSSCRSKISNSRNNNISNNNLARNGKFSLVYFRKRFRKRKSEGFSDVLIGSTDDLMQTGHTIFRLSIPVRSIGTIRSKVEIFWLWHAIFLLYFGRLVPVWPIVRLELVLIDHFSGLKYFLFEICLNLAVSLLCLLLRTFENSSFTSTTEINRTPVASVRVRVSGLRGFQSGFMLGFFSSFPLRGSRWEYLQEGFNCKYKYSSLKVEEISKEDCTYSNIKSFAGTGLLLPKGQLTEKSTNMLGLQLKLLIGQSTASISLNPVSIISKLMESPNSNNDNINNINNVSKSNNKDKNIREIPILPTNINVLALPAPVQGTNSLIHSSTTPTAPRSVPSRARLTSLSRLWSSLPSINNNNIIITNNDDIDNDNDDDNNSNNKHNNNNNNNNNNKLRTGVNHSLSRGPSSKSRPMSQQKSNLNQEDKTINSQKSYSDKALSCTANLLVTAETKGWREKGVCVSLWPDEQQIRVQLSGDVERSYTHRASQVMQVGTTNRYTHAMMWRAGPDWSLEFLDRAQWVIFKQIYEECYNRNIRAASVKNIPTPGVRPVQDVINGKIGSKMKPFARGINYYRQVKSEVEVALDPARVLYDMDSGDEEWVRSRRGTFGNFEIDEDLFEKVMDWFEKIAYRNGGEEFLDGKIEELAEDVGPAEVVREIYSYWRGRREKKGMPLIRQLQPPLWKHYQKQIEEWERGKIQRVHDGARGKVCKTEKPAMFAFCLKPRGLHIPPNKGLKQRSHKKLFLSPPNNSSATTTPNRDHSGSHRIGKRVLEVESASAFGFQRISRSNSKKGSAVLTLPSDNCQINHSLSNSKRQKLNHSHSHMEEFKLRDAAGGAQHAVTVARLKREKAQLLLRKADLALHRAALALLIADAIQSSQVEDGNGEDGSSEEDTESDTSGDESN